MTGAGATVDTMALERATAVGESTRHTFAGPARQLLEFRNRVRALCGARAATGDGLEDFERMLAHLAATEASIDTVRGDVLRADSAPWQAPPDVEGRNPWTDPDSDSWVAGLIRLGTVSMPSPEFVQRLLDDGPGMIDVLTDREMTLANQVNILLTDPQRFVTNWKRAGAGAIDSTLEALNVLGARASLVIPGGDDLTERATGRRLGEELILGVTEGLRLLAADPDAFVRTSVGWDELVADPYRWSGELLPDAIVEAVSTGLPLGVVARSGRGATRAARATGIGQHLPVGSPRSAAPHRLPDLETQRRGEAEWAPADPVVSHRQAPFESPEGWVDDINGGGVEVPGRNNNCVDCARAAEANWRGQDAVAAPLAETERIGVSADRLEEWTGGKLVPASLDEIEGRLSEMGPGSSAIVTSGWGSGGAHAYNAVNDGGVVKWVDAQLGEVSTWPPAYADEVDVSIVIFIGPNGRPL